MMVAPQLMQKTMSEGECQGQVLLSLHLQEFVFGSKYMVSFSVLFYRRFGQSMSQSMKRDVSFHYPGFADI